MNNRKSEENVTTATFSTSHKAQILAAGAENGAVFLYEMTNLDEGITEWETGGREGAKIKRFTNKFI